MDEHAGAVPAGPFTVVLGIAQDAGYPATGCRKACCKPAWDDPLLRRHVSCLGIVDPQSRQRWLVDCTPDFREQLRLLDQLAPVDNSPGISGILLTHAHIGHYAGLIQLGREGLNTEQVPVYAMPRMRAFLEQNQPWRQLTDAGNIRLHELRGGHTVKLGESISAEPIQVPHRDELSETVGFVIQGPKRSLLYVPDADRWQDWDQPIEDLIARVDVAYIDGTFFADGELGARSMKGIPHPLVSESLSYFSQFPESERKKLRFIHFNHTNPLLRTSSEAARTLAAAGFSMARQGELLQL